MPSTDKKSGKLLTPITLSPDSKAYEAVDELGEKLAEGEAKNIALTGSYGSGKSSILKTLREKFPRYNYLVISLATLESLYESSTEKIQKDTNTNDLAKDGAILTEDKLNRLIEYSILQQIIYKEETSKLPQSRFRRIKHISSEQSTLIAKHILLFLVAFCIVFEPSWLRVNSFYELFSNPTANLIFDSIGIIYMLYLVFQLGKLLAVSLCNNRLNKLNIKDGEIELKDEHTSIFNKHLDEILYFFEVTKYDVVIIEDLDRFKTVDIFLKLREVNQLINESKSIKRLDNRPIVFIYAVRDDMFRDTCRTKFFDYIVTVIPVINPSNAGDKLYEFLNAAGQVDITKNECADLGIFIDDMRLLINIVNEYTQYRSKLNPKLIGNKLLGMIIYKNYHPDDFSALHNLQGVLYNLIKNKPKYIALYSEDIKAQVTASEKTLEECKSYTQRNQNELRRLYIFQYTEQHSGLLTFKYNGAEYSPKQIADSEELFNKLINNEIKEYTQTNYYGNKSTLALNSFKAIENLVDPKYTYEERLRIAKYLKEIDIEHQIDSLKTQIDELNALPLKEILNKLDVNTLLESAGKPDRLIIFLLQKGYIEEDFFEYISYFYEGAISASDYEFLLDLKIRKANPYNYHLTNIPNLILKIPKTAYRHISILNFDLINYLSEHVENYKLEIDRIINVVAKNKNYDFLLNYLGSGQYDKTIVEKIVSKWDHYLLGIPDYTTEKREKLICIYINFCTSYTWHDKEEAKSFISDSFKLLCNNIDHIDIQRLQIFNDKLDIQFKELQITHGNEDFLLNVINNNRYLLTANNLKIISEALQLPLYSQASYTAIEQSNNKSFMKNINDNLAICLKIFPETSIKETPESLLAILNSESPEKNKEIYLSKQIDRIKDIKDVDEDYYSLGLNSNIILPTWENIQIYFEYSDKNVNEFLKSYIERQSDFLALNAAPTEKKYSLLVKCILGTNILSLEIYKKLCPAFSSWKFNNTDLSQLDSDRILILIENDLLGFNTLNIETVKNKHNILNRFIERNISEYLGNQSLFQMTDQCLLYLMQSHVIKDNYKISLIKNQAISVINNNRDLASIVCKFTYNKSLYIENPLLLKALAICADITLKVKILLQLAKHISYSRAVVSSWLQAVGGKYAEITLSGHRPLLPSTDENWQIVNYLQEHQYISSHKEENGSIRINTKQS